MIDRWDALGTRARRITVAALIVTFPLGLWLGYKLGHGLGYWLGTN